MALLPNNRVVILSVIDVIDWIEGWYMTYISPYEPLYRPATASEDLYYIIQQYNGGNKDFSDYVLRTQYDDTVPDYLREYQIEELDNYIEKLIDKVLPEYGGCEISEVYLSIEKEMLFVLDRRRSVYVPTELCHAIGQINH